jgi:dolichyl-phosphate beta-glucosyltransferase
MRQLFIHILRVPADLTDTQCGFKLYRGQTARQLYSSAHLDGFLFDIEIILLALRLGYRIREFPIDWTADLDSRLTLLKSAMSVIREFFLLLVHPINRGVRT